MSQTGFDLEHLRHQLADRLDEHPVRDWSAPLLTAVIGLLDAHALAAEMALNTGETRLRLVGVTAAKPRSEFADKNIV